MPSWCRNKVTVLGAAEDVAAFRERARGPVQLFTLPQYHGQVVPKKASVEAFSFHRLRPLPDALLSQPYSTEGYNAEIAAWGVKWGGHASAVLRHVEDAGQALLTYRFVNPWRPPLELYRFVAEQWTRLVFAVSYATDYPERGRLIFRRTHIQIFAGAKWDASCGRATTMHEPKAGRELRGRAWERQFYTTHDAWVDAIWSDPLTRRLLQGDLEDLAAILAAQGKAVGVGEPSARRRSAS